MIEGSPTFYKFEVLFLEFYINSQSIKMRRVFKVIIIIIPIIIIIKILLLDIIIIKIPSKNFQSTLKVLSLLKLESSPNFPFLYVLI